jgi:hypothetical protein
MPLDYALSGRMERRLPIVVVVRLAQAECASTDGGERTFCQFRFIGREAGDELLRLQAKYARSYTVLQNHERDCSLCQLASRVQGRDSENGSDTLSDNEMCT